MFHMLDQCYTISNKLCREQITKHTKKSKKCQKQNTSINSNMFYTGKYYLFEPLKRDGIIYYAFPIFLISEKKREMKTNYLLIE